MKIVTSGWRYLDIDAYGGIVAYAELLNLLGDEADAVSTAPFNESVTSTIRKWQTELKRDYQPTTGDTFVVIDLSDPEVFDKFVDQARVVEIIDHHMEFTNYWRPRLGKRAHIEFIGAACTLVAERWQASGKLDHISEVSARLLMTGILDNTLNFEAGVTTERDMQAYEDLTQHANLPEDWPEQYFEECQHETLADLKSSIMHDMKIIGFPSFSDKIGTGQLVVWSAHEIVKTGLSIIRETMAETSDNWFMNIVSIGQKKNFLVVSNETMQKFLERLINAHFEDNLGATDKLWLRKEIMKADLDTKP